jgi:glycosyltransferase involved in cell wall biosynthesis
MKTHAVVIPTYNTGPDVLLRTVRDVLAVWTPVWVIIDGSDDGSAEALEGLAASAPGLRVLRHDRNRGKGAAVLTAALAARQEGITHILTMDADGQHSVQHLRELMNCSLASPGCLILGEPVFDESAPAIRLHGRKICNWWTNLETLWGGIHDSLFGLRVYPVDDLIRVMHSTRFARRFDFDVEAAVRLLWRGVRPINVPTPVRYLSAEEGGVTQFRYLRDNTLLTWMHFRLLMGFFLRLPLLVYRRTRPKSAC